MLDYYDSGKGGRAASADRHRQYRAHLEPELGDLTGDAVRQRHADQYIEARVGTGASPKTAHNELAYLRTALRYGWQNDLLPQPPRFSLKMPHSERTRVAYPEEAGRLLAMADLPLRRVVAAAWTCGLRRGEILAARWEWTTTDRHELTLPARATKGRRERVVVFPEAVWEMLQAEPRHSEHVFCHWRQGRNGRGRLEVVPWTKRTLRTAFEELVERADSDGLWLHDLRRSMATVAQDRGHAPSTVQRVGGWEDPTVMARHYTHPSREAQERVVEDLSDALMARAGTGGIVPPPKILN